MGASASSAKNRRCSTSSATNWNNRPCIIYCRQTDKRNIQNRATKARAALPLAKGFILEAKVDPDKREAVIDKAVNQGFNVILSNPELVKTGLDLVFAGTLIFFEPIYNLGTMMQAAAATTA